MGIFGWSYPPGCNSVPGDDDEDPCECCGRSVDDCICEECSECGEIGDPRCYLEHGLELTPEQVDGISKLSQAIYVDLVREREMCKGWVEESLE